MLLWLMNMGFAGGGGEQPEPVAPEVMYWGLLNKRRKRVEQDEVELELQEAQPPELAIAPDDGKSAIQAAMRRALIEKSNERKLDEFIDRMAAETARKQAALNAIADDDEQMAIAITFLM